MVRELKLDWERPESQTQLLGRTDRKGHQEATFEASPTVFSLFFPSYFKSF